MPNTHTCVKSKRSSHGLKRPVIKIFSNVIGIFILKEHIFFSLIVWLIFHISHISHMKYNSYMISATDHDFVSINEQFSIFLCIIISLNIAFFCEIIVSNCFINLDILILLYNKSFEAIFSALNAYLSLQKLFSN